jgi:hypothetical protein
MVDPVHSNQFNPDVDVPLGTIPGVQHYYEGRLFNPGAENFVRESDQTTPLLTVWGYGMMYKPNPFPPIAPPPLYAFQTSVTNGLGGVITGQIALQGLLDDGLQNG